jgi:hypothetical protein
MDSKTMVKTINTHLSAVDGQYPTYISLHRDFLKEVINVIESLAAKADMVGVLEKALLKACNHIHLVSGSCPYERYDYDLDCSDNCQSQYVECWQRYFVEISDEDKPNA